MIVAMKKLTLLCLERDGRATIHALYEMGAVHVTNVTEPAGEDVERARAELENAREAVELVRVAANRKAPEVTAWVPAEGAELDEAVRLSAGRRQMEKVLTGLRAEAERAKPLGDFDPAALRELERCGIGVMLLRASLSARVERPEGAVVQEIAEDGRYRYFIFVAPDRLSLEDLDLGGVVDVIRPPERSLGELIELIGEHEGELERIDCRLAALDSRRTVLTERLREMEEASEFAQVRAGMGRSEAVSYLEGYVPEGGVEAVRRAAAEHGWGLAIRDPRRDEPVPTLVRYPRVARPIKVLFDTLRITPGYWETDVSWAFLAFLTLFVGLLIGDAGYGFLLLGAGVFMAVRFRGARRSSVGMLYAFGLSTILFGALGGSWLGIVNLPPFLQALKVEWLSGSTNVMELCFLIGAIHLSLAHAWNTLIEFPRATFLAQIGWIAVVWSMFFLARAVVLGRSFPGFVAYVLGVGVVLVIVFMTPFSRIKQDWMDHMLLLLKLVGFFVDVISYIRLFAVGVATIAVMQSFNAMAASVGFDSVPAAFLAIVALIFGHSLNLALCLLGVLVHGVRLNTLEFSTHKGLSWSGFSFRPFGRRSHQDEATAAR